MKFTKYMVWLPLMVVAYLFNTSTIKAQELSIIRLLDKESSLPIIGATYIYSDQNGISDKAGDIEFRYEPGSEMSISHVSYGKWKLSGPQVPAAIGSQVIYRQRTIVNLYPVTVIALRTSKKPTEKVEMDYQERLAHDAAQILNQSPGLNSIRKSGNYGFDPVFRGFKYDQLNIVLNGAQSATAACPNRMDPPTSQMSPNMTDRVEVLKGPHALRYGTGFGATINFVPVALRFTEKPDVYGRVSSGYEGNGNIWRSEGQIGHSSKKYDLAVFGSWSQGNDYDAGNGQLVQADFNRGSFGTNIGFKFSESNQLRLSANYNVARDADFPALPMDLREDDTWMLNLRHDLSLNKVHLSSWSTTAYASFVDHLMDNLLKPLEPRMLNASTNATTHNFGARTEGVWNFENSNLFAGMDFRQEGAEGIRVREFLMGPNAGNIITDNAWQDGSIGKTGVFAEFQYNLEKIRLVMSTRLEHNTGNIDEPTPEFTQIYDETEVTQFNPSFSLGATKSLSDKIDLGIWLGRTQRSASLTERYINYFPVGQDPFEMLGNPQLDPEVNNQIDFTLSRRTSQSNITVDLFAGYLQDFISSVIVPELDPRLPNSPGVRQFINIRDAFKTGFEFNWSQELFYGIQHQLGVAYTYAQDLERDEPLPEIAPMDFRYSLFGNFVNERLRPELLLRYVMRQSRISQEFGETSTPSFSLLDIKMDYQLTESAKISIGINNLFDENYYEHLARSVRGNNDPIFAPGRNAFASFSYVF